MKFIKIQRVRADTKLSDILNRGSKHSRKEANKKESTDGQT